MSSDTPSWSGCLDHLLQGNNLSPDEATALMHAWLTEELEPVQTGAFLAGLRAKGMVDDELAAMAAVLRDACSLPCTRPDLDMVDTCGTGGDGANTFNISTAVAFTAAACGVNVAKHGNRSASGKVGSADVLEGLGINLKSPLNKVVEALPKTGVTFLFAPAWHPALVNLAPLRRTLGVRTVFNLLGPLVNPLQPQAQVLGVARPELLDPMAGALQQLGLTRAVVVHGAGGLDEASLAGPNALCLIESGGITTKEVCPEDLGLTRAGLDLLRGGDCAVNQQILQNVLQGQGSLAQAEVVAFNTGLVLWAAGLQIDLTAAVAQALIVLNEGKAWDKLVALRDALSH